MAKKLSLDIPILCACGCGNYITSYWTNYVGSKYLSGHNKKASWVDLTGKKFGRLLVLSLSRVANYVYFWNCLCDCGQTKIIRTYSLLHNKSVSCGCLQKETMRQMNTTHGLSKTKLYRQQNYKKYKYNLTPEQYIDLFKKQNYCCAVCNKDIQPYTKEACIDHDHVTDKIRGILCQRCNQRLGFLETYRVKIQDYLNGGF